MKKQNNILSDYPNYKFVSPSNKIFFTGAPLTGKTIASVALVSRIEGLTLLSMDLARIFAQQMEELKPKKLRNNFVYFGSCDSYQLIGDGTPSTKNIIQGFNNYSKAVFSSITYLLPRLEPQGCANIIIEGVQLMPNLLKKRLDKNSRLIIFKSNSIEMDRNRFKMYGNDRVLNERYSMNRLLLIQNEILRQAGALNKKRVFIVENTGTIEECITKIIGFLKDTGLIIKIDK